MLHWYSSYTLIKGLYYSLGLKGMTWKVNLKTMFYYTLFTFIEISILGVN